MLNIDYFEELKKVEILESKTKKFDTKIDELSKSIENLNADIEILRTKISDERQGAELVNKYLAHYFGHDSLKLEAFKSDEDQKFKFKITRNGQPAYNMSEGECSLVSFCYFIAKLQDTDTKGKTPVIYIDDPISSLDSNHIFFIFSLIESEIAAPLLNSDGEPLLDNAGKKTYSYEQLFISTHNLEFLKLLQKLSRPKNSYRSFLVVKDSDGSQIRLMPSYLSNYITEFNYLFEQIYICVDNNNINDNFHAFYSFGNNLRKFLEAFLFYKYPFSESSQQDYNTRVRMFFNTDETESPLVQRITNEFSHLGSYVDRGERPVDSAEISTLARFVMEKIKASDPEQFKCLLKSIDKNDPIPA